MPEGYDADLPTMDAAAGELTHHGDGLVTLGGDAGSAASSAAGGVLGGPLVGALDGLTAEIQTRTQTLGQAVTVTGQKVTESAAGYRRDDAAAAGALNAVPIVLPGLTLPPGSG